ncbi:Signal recognition particle receptor subunit alpha [Saccharomycopsis crataegensis]|uniref:Signal recognition particle receptor subunit alpha homolog n=1 Tax=Saccharomycopsis crataegensis TaxID=43959 RepID=A0AAV5QRH4_9ASCO|nr:Signal recognition particle receptor subunit alpha [Saccharomycopsis crataegensis]
MSLFNNVIIFTGSGVVLFKHSPGGAFHRALNLVNSMITDIFINFNPSLLDTSTDESFSDIKTYSKNNDVLKYINIAGQDEVFVGVVYSSLAATTGQIGKLNRLLTHLKDLFTSLILDGDTAEYLKGLNWLEIKNEIKEKKFGVYVDQLTTKVETDDINVHDSSDGESSESEEEELEKEEKKIGKLKAAKKPSPNYKSKNNKKGRKWTENGEMDEDANYETLDFTESNNDAVSEEDVSKLVGKNYGHSTKDGFIMNDISQEIDDILSTKSKQKSTEASSGSFAFLKKYIGLGQTITEETLVKPSNAIRDSLIKKNVSAEISEKLVGSLKPRLVGKKLKNFTSAETEIRGTLASELTKILTPNTSIDLLKEIYTKKSKHPNNPYVISVVGVNGVGKSTNLSKLAYWLLNNKFSVLIAACDTFRSGAVEQLKVHERHLNKLIDSSSTLNSKLKVFEQGYGNNSKVAVIAKKSIQYAKDNGFDIVLMDTAGRSHADSKLMAPLKDFALAAQPDKIIMVAEALVGTDSVLQARNFNKSFDGTGRKIDFFIISKCDTVGDLIGTMVNMVYSTGIPILFVGVGQTYTDLRTLSVEWAVNTLIG